MGIFKKVESEPENPFAGLVQNQTIVLIPEFELESGEVLQNIPLAYKTWGQLNETGDNCLVICHALTGSADVSDWWGPLLGPGKAFDPTKFFIICLNSLGSPYGSASPVTNDPTTGERYGPEFPLCTVRDDVRIHKLVLDDLGVKQIACAVGGSMGGTLVLEWAYLGAKNNYVKNIIPLATSARHSAWCISWSEAQRQCIYSDPKYLDGYYDPKDPPSSGLGAARMTALLTYRSRNSFESRFGRKDPNIIKDKNTKPNLSRVPSTPREENWAIHNEGHRLGRKLLNSENGKTSSTTGSPTSSPARPRSESQDSIASTSSTTSHHKHQTYFSAQSYLRYQGEKFISRFDANCYISITRKMDTHDLARERDGDLETILESLKQPALVIGISSDGLFTYTEQETLAKHMPNAKLVRINSPEGHDAFLLEFAAIDKLIIDFLGEHCKEIIEAPGIEWNEQIDEVKDSVFGEAEDVTNW